MLLSHSQICSTIAAEVLNYRVREGNVCDYLAMSTGKKSNKEDYQYQVYIRTICCDTFFTYTPEIGNMRKKVVKPHDI